jgi:hypothetical protein
LADHGWLFDALHPFIHRATGRDKQQDLSEKDGGSFAHRAPSPRREKTDEFGREREQP